MDFYLEENYKELIRHRVKELRRTRPHLTLKVLAKNIPLQYTYLSKVLNDQAIHFSEDHLFAISEFLDFYPEQIEYLRYLRELQTAQNPGRKEFIQKQINRIRHKNAVHATVQDASERRLREEFSYLFDPWTVLVHVSLHISAYQKAPRRLCSLLGISPSRLDEILKKLQQLEFLELSENRQQVTKVKKSHVHYSSDHPLMRIHQQLLRSLSTAQLLKLEESEKHSFQVLFSAHPGVFPEIKAAFKEFIGKVEKIALDAPSKHTYQLNFDLLKWL